MEETVADPAGTDAIIAEVLGDRPDVVAVLDGARQASWAAAGGRRRELVRVRGGRRRGGAGEGGVATPGIVLGPVTAHDVATWPTHPAFDELDRAALAFAEQWVVDVAGMTDELVAPLRDALGDDGLSTFTNALMVIEQRMRLRQTWERLGLAGDRP